MQIKQKSESVIELIGEKGKAVFLYPGAEVSTDPDTRNIGFVEDDNVVYRPGEYERSEISVFGIETKSDAVGMSDVFVVNVDGVNLLFVGNEKYTLKKEQRDLVSKVDVLVINLKMMEDLDGLINKVEPGAVVAINFESPEQAAKVTDLSATEVESKIKFEVQEFVDEDAAITLHLLGK